MAPHSRPQSTVPTVSDDDDEPASPRTLLLGDYKDRRRAGNAVASIQESSKKVKVVVAQWRWTRTYVLFVVVMLSLLQVGGSRHPRPTGYLYHCEIRA